MSEADGGRVLVVDDDADTRELLSGALGKRGFEVATASSASEALELVRRSAFDAVAADVHLGEATGIELCRKLVESEPGLPVIIVTGQGNLEIAIEAIRAGAYDFITKPVSVDALAFALSRAISHRQLRREVERLRTTIDASRRLDNMVGASQPIREVFEVIERVADSDASVLVAGESGTGKELVARSLHSCSSRKAAPFVAINCAAMPPNLLESELFGHVRGAFTDAKRDRPGLFIQASGGTLFLDEIGEMPMEMQAKLLRVLQERKLRPVGGDSEVTFDIRLVTATNRDLEAEVEEGRFREDLFYRVNVVQIVVPPLRARQGDILLLAQTFLERFAKRSNKKVTGISSMAAQKLLDFDWPGNVRELENCMERAVALTRLSEITVDDLPAKIKEHASDRMVIASDNPEELLPLAEMERRYVRRVLAAVNGNKTQAARILGLDRRSLYRRLEKSPGDTAKNDGASKGDEA